MSDPVVLLQLSDLHIGASVEDRLLGLDTRRSFLAVLDRARQRFPQAAACLLSGDLADQGEPSAYTWLTETLRDAPWPCLSLPGNHDQAADLPFAARSVSLGRWQLLLLDSTRPDHSGGRLSADEYAFLQQALQDLADRPVLIALHHHPIPCGCAWLDSQGLGDAEAFWGLLAQHPKVRALLHGHVHQAREATQAGVQVLAAPATSLQFLPDSAEFALDRQGPGFRWLRLCDDGSLETGIERLPVDDFPADYANREGY